LWKNIHAAAGYDNDSRRRTFQETEHTRERTVWGTVALQDWHNIDASLKVVHGQREQSGYLPVTATGVIENPLLIKYNMANRFRDSAELRVDTTVGEKLTLGGGVDIARDEYPDSQLGLTYGKDISYNVDATVLVTHTTSAHLFASHEEIQSRQLGSQNFSTPDWSGRNDDTISCAGVGIKRSKLWEKLDLGVDYMVTSSHGAVVVETGASAAPFPDLASKRDTLKLYGVYRLKDKISLQGSYWYEQYHSDNWQLAGVTPATISNVLTFGQLAPVYHVNVVSLSGRYQFK
jgi:MtrB/PioB family decaheme-associated outer membrane protein